MAGNDANKRCNSGSFRPASAANTPSAIVSGGKTNKLASPPRKVGRTRVTTCTNHTKVMTGSYYMNLYLYIKSHNCMSLQTPHPEVHRYAVNPTRLWMPAGNHTPFTICASHNCTRGFLRLASPGRHQQLAHAASLLAEHATYSALSTFGSTHCTVAQLANRSTSMSQRHCLRKLLARGIHSPAPTHPVIV